MAPFPVDPSGGDGQGCARLVRAGRPRSREAIIVRAGRPRSREAVIVRAGRPRSQEAFIP